VLVTTEAHTMLEDVMHVDLAGKINNTKLPYTNALWPLFETVVNAIHAIEDSKIEGGRIDVHIERDEQQLEMESVDRGLPQIRSFVVVDNGIGFTNANYKSFKTSDSTHKAAKLEGRRPLHLAQGVPPGSHVCD
jgi:hypothetical protein